MNPVDLNNTAPKVHASPHRTGGSDPLTPADIGAAAVNHTHDVSGYTVAWEDVTNIPGTFPSTPHAATHGSGGGDPLAIDASQIATGTVPLARLPHGCLERLVIVQDDTARYALTTAEVQQGDTVKVIETSTMYFVVDDTQLANSSGYVAYTAGAASAVDWSAITGKPVGFVLVPDTVVLSGSRSAGNGIVTFPVNGLVVTSVFVSCTVTSDSYTDTNIDVVAGSYRKENLKVLQAGTSCGFWLPVGYVDSIVFRSYAGVISVSSISATLNIYKLVAM